MAERVLAILARQEMTEESTEEDDDMSVSQDTQRAIALLFLITDERT